MRKKPIYLVAYIDYDGANGTYACAFSTRQLAEDFSRTVGGNVIETYVDIHADLTRRLEPF
jgi:nitrous oxide reductase accessory protein NosL